MNLFHRRAICVFASIFLATAFVAVRLPPLPKIIAAAVTVLALILSCLPKLRLRALFGKRLLFLAIAILLALLLPLLIVDLPTAQILSKRRSDGNLLEFRVAKELKDGLYVADRVSDNGDSLPFVSLLAESAEALRVGERVRVTAKISPLTKDDVRYYGQNGCHAVASVTALHFSEQEAFSLRSRIASLSDSFLLRVRRAGGEAGDLLAALLLGETDCLRDSTALHFRRLGISHILAVSGMHFVTLSMALAALLRRFCLPRPAVIAITLPLMLFYTVLTGAPPSVLRAFAMALVMQLSYFFGRRSDTLTSLFFSGMLLSLFNPFLLFSVSFLLSFCATLGIVVCFHAVRCSASFARLSPRLRDFLVAPLLSTVAATLFTLPITLTVFGQLSLLALPANLLLGLPFQLLLCLAVPALILGPIPAVTAAAEALASPLLSFVRWLSSFPMATVDASHPLIVISSALLIACLLFLLLMPRVSRRLAKALSFGGGTLLLLSLLITAPPRIDRSGIAVATKTDNGDFVILSTGVGRAVLSCSGDEHGNAEVLFEALSRDRVTELSLYVPAHYDSASLSELRSVCRRYHVRRVALSYPQGDRELSYCEEMISYLKSEDISFELIPIGHAVTVGSFSVSLSTRTAAQNEPPAYAFVVMSPKGRVAYLSGSASVGLNAELARALRADTLILGSLGLTEEIPVFLPKDARPGRIVSCSPYHTAESDLTLTVCKDYLAIP